MATASTRPTTAANLFAFDVETGRQLWKQNLGTVQKASTVFADGKIYIGSESGKFFILRPHADRCEILSEVELPLSDTGLASQKIPEPIVAAAAVARGRVYFVSSDTLYAIGPKKTAGACLEARGADDGTRAGRSGLGAGGAHRDGAEARRDGAIARAPVRCGGPLPARREIGDLVARSSEGNGDRWQVRQWRPIPTGQAGLIKATRRQRHRRGARARDPAAALERDVRFLRRSAACRRTG